MPRPTQYDRIYTAPFPSGPSIASIIKLLIARLTAYITVVDGSDVTR